MNNDRVGQLQRLQNANAVAFQVNEVIAEWEVVGPRLLLLPVDPNQEGTLYRPQSATEELLTRECKIIKVGDVEQSSPLFNKFRPGRHVYIGLYKGAKIELGGQEFVMVDIETDVLLVKKETA